LRREGNAAAVKREALAIVEELEAGGYVRVEGEVVVLTAKGRALAAARRKAREEGRDPDEAVLLVSDAAP